MSSPKLKSHCTLGSSIRHALIWHWLLVHYDFHQPANRGLASVWMPCDRVNGPGRSPVIQVSIRRPSVSEDVGRWRGNRRREVTKHIKMWCLEQLRNVTFEKYGWMSNSDIRLWELVRMGMSVHTKWHSHSTRNVTRMHEPTQKWHMCVWASAGLYWVYAHAMWTCACVALRFVACVWWDVC